MQKLEDCCIHFELTIPEKASFIDYYAKRIERFQKACIEADRLGSFLETPNAIQKISIPFENNPTLLKNVHQLIEKICHAFQERSKIVFVEITHQKEKIETPAQFTVEELMAFSVFQYRKSSSHSSCNSDDFVIVEKVNASTNEAEEDIDDFVFV